MALRDIWVLGPQRCVVEVEKKGTEDLRRNKAGAFATLSPRMM